MSNWLENIRDDGIDHFEFAFEQAYRPRTGVTPSMHPAAPLALDALPLPSCGQAMTGREALQKAKSADSLSLTQTQKSVPKPVVYACSTVVPQTHRRDATGKTTALRNAERTIGVAVLRRALPLRFARIDAWSARTCASPAVPAATHGS